MGDLDSKDKGGGCQVQYRYVLVGLLFCACTIDFLTRYSISVAIVAMVNSSSEAHDYSNTSINGACPLALNNTNNASNQNSDSEGEYDWSYEDQGIILGTFFWGYFISKAISGRLAERYGPREVVSISLLLCGIMSLLCPWSAHVHPLMLAGCRLIIGIAQGPIYPVINIMLVRWVPHERITTMFALVCQGVAFGTLLATLGSGWVISVLGWRWVFWGGGLLTLALLPPWIIFVRNDPEEHPYISQQERELLKANIHVVRSKSVPWGNLWRCYHVYLCMFIEFIMCWCDTVTQVDGPTYLTNQIGLTLFQSSTVLGVAQIIRLFCGFLPSVATDFMIQKKIISKLKARRLMHAIAMVVSCGGLFCLPLIGCSITATSAIMVILVLGSVFNAASYVMIPMDIVPNYAGTMAGIMGIGSIGAFLAPIGNAAMLSTSGGWNAVFLVSGALYLVQGLLFIFTSSTDLQPWNVVETAQHNGNDSHHREKQKTNNEDDHICVDKSQ